MKYYFSQEEDCQNVTPNLEPVPKVKRRIKRDLFNKKPTGPLPIGHLDRVCDGRVLSYEKMTDRTHGGTDWIFFFLSALSIISAVMVYVRDGDAMALIPWSSHPLTYETNISVWGVTSVLLALGFLFRYKAKNDGFENIVFNRINGTVTFAEAPGRKRLTVPFLDVDAYLSGFSSATVGTRSYRVAICTTVKPKGDKRVRRTWLPLAGISPDEFQREWNMICCFMDKGRSYPKCLRAIIDTYNNNVCIDIWDKPIPPEKRISRRQIGLPENFENPFSDYV